MARTKGALNKRTRAALSDAELGALGNDTLEFVDRFRKDTRKDDQQRYVLRILFLCTPSPN